MMRHFIALVATFLMASAPLLAADFVVLSAFGVLEPEDLEAQQELAGGTVLRLEPWGRAVLRETTGCGFTQVIVGAPEHKLQPAEDCSLVGAPQDVSALVQQGMAFAAPLDATSSEEARTIVEMLVNEPCVFLARVSEEGGNARRCPSGYALRGLRCSGEHCAFKDLFCCPYLGGEPDPDAKEVTARVISEEWPNISLSKHFLTGLACNGPFCDNILPYPMKSPKLKSTKQCEWTPWSADVPDQWLNCAEGSFISGIRCQDDYCGNVGVHCCQAGTP